MKRVSTWTMALVTMATLLLSAVTVEPVHGQTLTTLHSFDGTDGTYPSGLIQATDGNIYGVTTVGGAYCKGCGTVFNITLAGTLTTLHSFCSEPGCPDGQIPNGMIQAANGEFYGTTTNGGTHGNNGTVFEMPLGGTLTTLHSMDPGSRYPDRPLIQAADGNFYGDSQGGTNFDGSIYKINPSGKLTTLYIFCSLSDCPDGDGPNGLIQATDGNFYGTTAFGGANSSSCGLGCGTVFKITPGGTLTTLYSFCSQTNCTDGDYPFEGLIQANDGNFYGTTHEGGIVTSNCDTGCGTIFKITPRGTLTTLYSFCSQTNCTDGYLPTGVLVQGTDGNIYGTTTAGGASTGSCGDGCGTVFQITPGGTLATLYSFCSLTKCADGSQAGALMQDTNGVFYGTSVVGGAKNDGTVFSLSVGLGPFVALQTTSGPVGAAVAILGNDLTGSTRVSFNGAPAMFTVVSATEITTTVPSGAATGPVEVTTPGGKLKSNTKYAVKKSPAVPEFSPGTGTYSKAQSVAITDGSAGSMILYTTDGTPPATSSTALVYTGPIKVKSTETLEAVAVGIDDEPSAVAAAVYTIL